MKKILLCLFLTAGLTGCHIYRSYERPDVTVSDSLYRQPVAAEDTTSLASLSWKELFTDPQLQQLIETGLRQNTDLGIARLKVKEAEAALMTSRLSYLPSLSLTPQGTLTSADGSKTTKTYDLAVSAEWEIDIFGKLLNEKRGAQAALEQSEAYRQAVQTQLVATIANSYYTRKRTYHEGTEACRTDNRNGCGTDRGKQAVGRRVCTVDTTADQRDGKLAFYTAGYSSTGNRTFHTGSAAVPRHTVDGNPLATAEQASRRTSV